MFHRSMWKGLAGFLSACAVAGCSAEALPEGEAPVTEPSDTADPSSGKGNTDVGATAQPLGAFSHLLPQRGSQKAIVESHFLGSGMMYAMQLRTGALVDSVSASFYTPSLTNNRFTTGDPFFARGPVGGTAGSLQPRLECPAGYAAFGLCGRSGARIDQLGLICAQIGGDGAPVVSTQQGIGAFGGTGGTDFVDTCGAGKWLTGMNVSIALKSSGTNKIVSSVQGFCSNAS